MCVRDALAGTYLARMSLSPVYADLSARRSRQVLGDVLALVWVWLWWTLARGVHDATLALTGPGRQLRESGTGLGEGLRSAGERVAGLPLVGDDVASPFQRAGEAADRVAAAGQTQVDAVQTLATWLGVTVFLVPVLLVLVPYLALRFVGVRRAQDVRSVRDAGTGLDLLALRALSTQPLGRLASTVTDPAGAWRRGDPDVVRRLAELELRSVGLAPTRPSPTSTEGIPL